MIIYLPNENWGVCFGGRGNVSHDARLCSSPLVHPVYTHKTCMLNTLTSLTSSRSIHLVTIILLPRHQEMQVGTRNILCLGSGALASF